MPRILPLNTPAEVLRYRDALIAAAPTYQPPCAPDEIVATAEWREACGALEKLAQVKERLQLGRCTPCFVGADNALDFDPPVFAALRQAAAVFVEVLAMTDDKALREDAANRLIGAQYGYAELVTRIQRAVVAPLTTAFRDKLLESGELSADHPMATHDFGPLDGPDVTTMAAKTRTLRTAAKAAMMDDQAYCARWLEWAAIHAALAADFTGPRHE